MKLLVVLLWVLPLIKAFEWPTLTYKPRRLCSTNETYDPSMLLCEICNGPNTIPDKSGFGCTCDHNSRIIHDVGYYGRRTGREYLECEKCPDNHVPTKDKRFCIACTNGVSANGCTCPLGHILVERNINGQLLNQTKCIKCAEGSKPSPDGLTCVPCLYEPILKESSTGGTCNCTLTGGLCLPPSYRSQIDLAPSNQDTIVRFSQSEKNIDSAFFKENYEASVFMCNVYHNTTACQLLGNLCTLTLHDGNHPTCRILHSLIFLQRFPEVPHLFYESQSTKVPITNEDITTKYKLRETDTDLTKEPRSHRLNITYVAYSASGILQDIGVVNGGMFQMCNGSFQEFDAAFNFGTRYSKKCQIPSHILFKASSHPVFYDLYIPYTSDTSTAGSSSKLFAVPIMILNKEQNRDKSSDKKELTTRFFMVDTLTGIPTGKDNKEPEVIRYLKKFQIQVDMLNTKEFPEKAGRIFPPIVKIEYGEVTIKDLEAGAKMDFEFSVTYKMEMREARKDIEIAMGVLSAFAVLWSAMETWSWNRRSGKSGIDPLTLAKLLANTCGNLAHVFLSVVFFTSLYWFIFYKQQNYLHSILPTEDQENLIKNYVISIFALKIVDVIHLLISQMSIDIFLVDWEQPKPGQVAPRGQSVVTSTKEMAVSVWRTYLVANEWNEIQTYRKISHSLQVILVIFVLKVCGVENLATADPLNAFDLDDGDFHSEYSYVCRFALGVAIYASIALGQIVLWCGLYNNLIEDKLQQFTDVCSLANISVFAMAQSNFGYYIHGKSAHGFSDTDMATLLDQLQRESEDLCGHRGLLAGTDEQTFSMALPAKLRNYYDKVVTPATSMGGGASAGPRSHKLTGTAVQQMVQAYGTMNKFLTRFLEHALKDLDFEVRDRLFLESVMDIEFQDTSISEKAVFYKDSGHSFDALLFYGHEFSLIIFDIMLFSFVDLFAQDFLLAGIVTFFVGKTLMMIRQLGGKSNLAKKTLIDKRFLI